MLGVWSTINVVRQVGWDANVRLDVIASAAKQSIFCCGHGLLRCARNDVEGGLRSAQRDCPLANTSGKPAGNKNPEGSPHADPASSQRLPLATDPVAAGGAQC